MGKRGFKPSSRWPEERGDGYSTCQLFCLQGEEAVSASNAAEAVNPIPPFLGLVDGLGNDAEAEFATTVGAPFHENLL